MQSEAGQWPLLFSSGPLRGLAGAGEGRQVGRAVRLAPRSNWAPVAPPRGFERGVYFARPLGWAGLGRGVHGGPHCGMGWAAPGPWGLSPPGTPLQEEGATLGSSSGLPLPLGGGNFEIKKEMILWVALFGEGAAERG